MEKFASRTCDLLGDPHWISVFLKDCTMGKGPTLGQFVKNCSLWKGLMLEKLMENYLSWEGHHPGLGKECEELSS